MQTENKKEQYIGLPKSLDLGLETFVGDDAQIIMETGEHIASIQYSPSLETAQEIIKRYNAYPSLAKALQELIKKIEGNSITADIAHYKPELKNAKQALKEAGLEKKTTDYSIDEVIRCAKEEGFDLTKKEAQKVIGFLDTQGDQPFEWKQISDFIKSIKKTF